MQPDELTHEKVLQFSNLIKEYTGINFDEYKWLGLRISIKERMMACGITETELYFARLKSDLQEKDELVSLLTVPETYFFRDKKQFDVLRDKILPEMVEKRCKLNVGKPLIRIFSMGCSTGEEPYSLAIAVHQSGLMKRCEFEIIACDISKNSLAKAVKGEYTRYSFREKNTEFLENYFTNR